MFVEAYAACHVHCLLHRNANRYWTMVASGAPDMKGSREQTVWFRFQQIECAQGTDYTTGKSCEQVGQPQYWDTFWWTRFPGSGSGAPPPSPSSADQPTASGFYQSLLENRKWWDNELANEGMMQLSLPDVKTATNGTGMCLCVCVCVCMCVRVCVRACVRACVRDFFFSLSLSFLLSSLRLQKHMLRILLPSSPI